MTTMSEQEETSIKTLGKALQDARLSASLTVEEIAERLNLAVSTVRDIEDDLDNMIENQKYPHIYLRGYLANYAKLVALQKLNQFPEYQQLLGSQPLPKKQHPSESVSPVKKRVKRLLLLFLVIAVACLVFFIVKQVFFSENKTDLPEIEEIKLDDENTAPKTEVIARTETEAANVAVASENAEIPSVVSQTEITVVAQDTVVAKKVITATADVVAEQNVNPSITRPNSQTAILTSSESELKTEAIIKNSVNAQQLLSKQEVTEADAPAIELLQLTFSADCWTEIFDATDKRLAFDLYKKGTSITVNGVAPFRLKLGDPSVVAIQYQNKTVEHEFAAGHVVRFSIP